VSGRPGRAGQPGRPGRTGDDARRRRARSCAVAAALGLAVATAAACDEDDGAPAADGGVDLGEPGDLGPRDAAPPPPPPSKPGRHDVTVVETRQVVPGPGLPPETPAMASNNNLDVARLGGRTYLAWRTGPDHFASSETRIHVVSSADERAWRFETSLSLDRDLREPRFLVLPDAAGTPDDADDRLLLYVTRLGTSAIAFEPQGVSVVERRADGAWTSLEEVYEPGFLLWRARTETVAGSPVHFLVGYMGGEHIYDFSGRPIEVRLLTTTDGRAWSPYVPEHPAVYVGGGSEADFALDEDGALLAVIRNEAGDDRAIGSNVCRAPAGALSPWDCVADRKKYDSPLVFRHDGETYLIGRRNVTADGFYDLRRRPDASLVDQVIQNQLDYVRRPKRCALWRFVPEERRLAFILDLPSRGDTCFASRLPGETAEEIVVYDYSSPIDGPDVGWREGQMGRTNIYRHVLRFTRR
jgi:hypothetical protein